MKHVCFFVSMHVMIYYGVFNATRVSPYIDIALTFFATPASRLSKGPGDAKRTGRAEYFARSPLYQWHRLLPLDNAVVLLLFIHCLLLHHLFVCVCVWGGGVLVLLCST